MSAPSLVVSIQERRLALTAIIGAISVVGIQISLFLPLLSLIMDARGLSAERIGFSTTVGAISICAGALIAPVLLRRFGMAPFMAICFFLSFVCSILMKLFDDYYSWLYLRILFSLASVGLFTSSETWIGALSQEHNRGQIVGIYAAALGVGFAIGPAVLSEVGTEGWVPFLIGAGLMLLGALPLAWSRRFVPDLAAPAKMNPARFVAAAPVLAGAVFLFGAIETSVYSLLPLHGLRSHLSDRMATLAGAAFALGAIGLQIPIGWLADRFDRYLVLLACGLVGVIAPLLIPFWIDHPFYYLALVFVWGGIIAGLYTMALTIIGQRFKGSDLAAANASLVMSYGGGALIGPYTGGIAMDWWNPHGLIAVFSGAAVIFVILMVIIRPWREKFR